MLPKGLISSKRTCAVSLMVFSQEARDSYLSPLSLACACLFSLYWTMLTDARHAGCRSMAPDEVHLVHLLAAPPLKEPPLVYLKKPSLLAIVRVCHRVKLSAVQYIMIIRSCSSRSANTGVRAYIQSSPKSCCLPTDTNVQIYTSRKQ
jgi:hypothetical protein